MLKRMTTMKLYVRKFLFSIILFITSSIFILYRKAGNLCLDSDFCRTKLITETKVYPIQSIKSSKSQDHNFKTTGTQEHVTNVTDSLVDETNGGLEKKVGCRKLPDVLIIGFEKCGTMTLLTFLGIHPHIFVPHYHRNFHLFDRGTFSTVEEYRKRSSCTPQKKLRLQKISPLGEVKRSFAVLPNAKLIAIVREPVERAVSHYKHRVVMGIENNSYNFDSMIKSIMDHNTPKTIRGSVLFRQSRYIDRLKPWIELYGLANIHVVDGDNFIKNPAFELQKVEAFLGLKPYISEEYFVYNPNKGFYCLKQGGEANCMQEAKGRPHPAMSNVTRKRLQEYFGPYNKKLFQTLGRNFSWNY